jgi:hypothetical protein
MGFIGTIRQELKAISGTVSVELARGFLVVLENGQGMDSATTSDAAAYHFFDETTHHIAYGSLSEVNERVRMMEKQLSEEIEEGRIHGLICVSCHVPILSSTLAAASKKSIPVTGTGGTSLSVASATFPKLRLVGNAGGSVATTTLTKAISFSQAFANDFGGSYTPKRKWFQSNKNGPSWRSVLNSCLPAFWVVALAKKFFIQYQDVPFLAPFLESMLDFSEFWALPVTCSVVMATSAAQQLSPNTIMAAILASASSRKSIISGLFSGWLVSNLEEWMLYQCIMYWNAPATMTNLLKTGLVGILTAIIISPMTQYTVELAELVRNHLIPWILEPSTGMEWFRRTLLFAFGTIFCYGSKVGWYHSIFLPLILLEMEHGGASFLGAVDQLTLVLVSAGICFAKWILRSGEDVALVKRGLRTNLLCGDFIEVAYPFMEESQLINVGGYLASGLSVSMLSGSSKSSAYLPLPLALWLADDWKEMAVASTVAITVSFLFTILDAFLKSFINEKKEGRKGK